MKKNKDNIFGKAWTVCLVFIVALSVCGMMPQVKNTYAAPTLYGMYRWPVSDTKDSSGTKWDRLQDADYVAMADEKENKDVVFNVNFKSGGYTPTDFYELENYALNINDSNMSSFNKIKVKYWKNDMVSCGYYPSGLYGCSGSEYNSDIYYGNSTYLNLFTNVSGSSPSPLFHWWNYYEDVQTNYLTLDFGTDGATVTGEEYGGFLGIGKKNYDAEKFVEYFEKAAIKINACYYEEDKQAFSWGHGSDYIGATLFPEFDTQELCKSMKVVEFTTGYGNLSCDSSSEYKCIKESNQKLILFLPSSVGGNAYNITKLYDITNVPNNIVMSENFDVSYTDVYGKTNNEIVTNKNIFVKTNDYNYKIKTVINTNPKVTFMVEGKVYATKTIKYGEKLSTILPKNPSAPGNTGYTFIGWYLDGKQIQGYDRITKDLVLTAKFATAHRVAFYKKKYAGDSNVILKNVSVAHGLTIDKPDPDELLGPPCDGDDMYVAGWADSDTDKEFDFTKGVTKPYKLYPICEVKTPVYFYVNGSLFETQYVAPGSLASKPDESKFENIEDEFLGWSLNNPDWSDSQFKQYLFKTTPVQKSSVNLYAWFREPITIYYVTLYPDIGSTEKLISYEVKATDRTTTIGRIISYIPIKEGHVFKTWVLADGTEYNPNRSVSSDVDLYATWTKIFHPDAGYYGIEYNGNADGVTNVPSSVSFKESTEISSIYPSRNDDFAFTGWNTKSDCSGRYFARGATVYKNDVPEGGILKLYACWAPVTDQCSFKNTTK